MTITLVPNALEHISSQELARLSALWHVQASTGQVEAREIAQVFSQELIKRLDSRRIDYLKASSRKSPKIWWRSLIFKIGGFKKTDKGLQSS